MIFFNFARKKKSSGIWKLLKNEEPLLFSEKLRAEENYRSYPSKSQMYLGIMSVLMTGEILTGFPKIYPVCYEPNNVWRITLCSWDFASWERCFIGSIWTYCSVQMITGLASSLQGFVFISPETDVQIISETCILYMVVDKYCGDGCFRKKSDLWISWTSFFQPLLLCWKPAEFSKNH